MNKTTSVLLANITDMQSRLLEMQQQLAAQLQRENGGNGPRGRVPYSYDRGANQRAPFVEPAVPHTSIRLQHASQSVHTPTRIPRPQRAPEDSDLPLPRAPRAPRAPRNQYNQRNERNERNPRNQPNERNQRAPHSSRSERNPRMREAPREEKQDTPYETVTLSSVLQADEEVSLRVIIKKDEEGQPVYTTMTTTFDGSVLRVVASELAPQMVDVQSAKPGEILYQFIDALKSAGHLKRSFTIAPWKLCTVVRDGQTVTLEDLRRAYLASKSTQDVDNSSQ